MSADTLFQHQREGAATLALARKKLLGDVPGLGKTRTLLEATRLAGAKHTLVVAPAIVRTHWRNEVAALGLDPMAYTVKSYDAIVRGGASLMVDLLRGDMMQPPVDALVLDESHYLKHGGAQRTKTLLGVNGYARRLGVVFPATGTPLPKHPGEVWTTLAAIFPDVVQRHGFKSRKAFMDRFCVVDGRMIRGHYVEKVVGVKNTAELYDLLGEVMLRRTLADVGLDVPPLLWQRITVDTSEPTDDLAEGALITADTYDTLRAIANGDDLASIANDPHVARMRRRIGELKVAPVVEMASEFLDNGDDKLVIFAHHRSVLNGLRDGLARFGVAYVDGDVSDDKRREAIERFQGDRRVRVFIGQNIACQTGITLTASSRALLVEPDWTAVVNEQLGYRVARIGQVARHCIAQMIALGGTLDEAIVGQHYREVRMARAVLGAAA